MINLPPWIETYTGKHFYFLNPTHDQVDIKDIAHALAYTCRYTGHCKKFYSVAEHSILVSYLATDPLAGLLHDASEAYITDIASPIKDHLGNYRTLEDRIMSLVANKYGFVYPLDPDIKDCDSTQLKTEAKYLLKSGGLPWAHMYPTKRQHGIKPQCLPPEAAEKAFLERYEEVRNVSVDGFESNNQSSYSTRLHPVDRDPSLVWYMEDNQRRPERVQTGCPSSRHEANGGSTEAGRGFFSRRFETTA